MAQRWGRERTPGDGVCFYEHADYRGDYFCVRTGENLGSTPTASCAVPTRTSSTASPMARGCGSTAAASSTTAGPTEHRAYLSVLGRGPDSGSRGYVDKVLHDKWTQHDVERELQKSPEYRNRNRQGR